jgi:hypothetical protein
LLVSLHRHHGSVFTGMVVPNLEINMSLDIPKCETVGIFIMGRQKVEYLFVIDGKLIPMMMNRRKWQY